MQAEIVSSSPLASMSSTDSASSLGCEKMLRALSAECGSKKAKIWKHGKCQDKNLVRGQDQTRFRRASQEEGGTCPEVEAFSTGCSRSSENLRDFTFN